MFLIGFFSYIKWHSLESLVILTTTTEKNQEDTTVYTFINNIKTNTTHICIYNFHKKDLNTRKNSFI